LTPAQIAIPAVAAFAAGAMNSVAGGGSFLSFPALIFAGVPPISANATNNCAMWVGTIGSARGYKEEIKEHRKLLLPLICISIVGGIIGACVLLMTPSSVFERLIPWLLLFATTVFALSPLLVKKDEHAVPKHKAWQFVVQFFVSIYGGYFGAGMGIVMLAVLAFTGLPNFNAQNAMKNALSVTINGVALIPFIIARVIDWRFAIPMAVIALAGGYFGARFFRQLPQKYARIIVIAIGVTMTALFFTKVVKG
jgi:uncharacterized protein